MPDDLKRNMTARQPMPLSPIRHDAIHDYRDQIWDDFHSMSPREGQRLTHKYIWPTFEPTEKNKRLQRQYRLAEESIRARHESPPRDDLPGRFYEIPMQGEPKSGGYRTQEFRDDKRPGYHKLLPKPKRRPIQGIEYR